MQKLIFFYIIIILGKSATCQDTTYAFHSTYHSDNIDFIYTGASVDSLAHFEGGENLMFKFISDHVKYPPTAIEKNIVGRVYVSFIVEKDGTVSDIKIVKSENSLFDSTVLSTVALFSHHWKPAYKNGKPVRMEYNLPIHFTLPDEVKQKKK